MAVSDARQGESWQKSGATEYRFEPPDIIVSRITGAVAEQDAIAVFDFLRRRAAERRPIFWLHDGAHAPSPPPAVRKIVAKELRSLPLDGAVTFGGTLQTRVLTKLGIQAVQLLNPGAVSFAYFIAENEAEARAWIAQRRRALLG